MANKFQVNYEENNFDYAIKKRSIPPFLIVIIVMLILIVLALGVLIIKNVVGSRDGMDITGDDTGIFADYSDFSVQKQNDEDDSSKATVSNDVTWQIAAIDVICNYKKDNSLFKCDDGFFFYLIDVTNDGVPEVFQGPVSKSGNYFEICSFYYWDGTSYAKGTIDTESDSVHCFLPFKVTADNALVFWDHVIPDDYKFHMNNVSYYANSGRIAFENGRLFYAENIDRSTCVDAIINDDEPSEEQTDDEQATYVDPGFVAYKTDFDSRYIKLKDFNRAYYGYWGDVNSDEELYDELITREEAKRVVESYLNNDIVGHFD